VPSAVQFAKLPLEGVPNTGVTNVGLVANTRLPVPVSSVNAAIRLALDGVPKNVATPEASPVTSPIATDTEPFEAAVIRPCASTVILLNVYDPAVTAVLSRFSVTVSVVIADERPVPPEIVIVSLRSKLCVDPESPATDIVAFCKFVKFASPSTKDSAEPLPALVTIVGLAIETLLVSKKRVLEH
jgi:hypothetical protein